MNTTVSVAASLQSQVRTATSAVSVVQSPGAERIARPVVEQTGVSPGVSRFDVTSALRLLTGQVLNSLTMPSGAKPMIAEDLGFVPPEDANAAGAQLSGVVRGVLGGQSSAPVSAVATGNQSVADQSVVSRQVAAGIEAGYQETVRLLAQKGPIPSDVQIELQQSRELAFAAVAESVASDNASGVQVAGAQTVAATNSRSATVTVRTQDGDTVNLQISGQRSIQVTTAALGGEGEGAASLSTEQSREYQFNLTVDGDLDRGEMKALRNLMHEIKGVLKEFAKADYADAIEKFSELKLNTEYLANVAMDLSSTRSIAVAGLYAAAATILPSANAAPVVADAAQPIESTPASVRVIPDPAPSAPRSESTGVAIRLAAARTSSYSANVATRQQASEVSIATYSRSSSPIAPSVSPPVAEPGSEVASQEAVDLAELLAPFISLFRDLLGGGQFAKPGNLIAELTAAVLNLQGELFPAESDADADTDVGIEGDFDDDSAAQSEVKTASIGDTQNAMKTLLQEFMGALDNRQENDRPERHGEADDQGDQSDSKPEHADD